MKEIKVGKIIGFHGLKGEVKVKSSTDFAKERFQVGNELFLSDQKNIIEVKIRSVRYHKNNYLIAFDGYPSLNDVEMFKGYDLIVKEEMLNELEEDEFYYFDLIGMKVYDHDNNLLGTVSSVMETGANEVLVIKGDKEILIPFVDHFIKDIDLDNKTIHMEEVEGLY